MPPVGGSTTCRVWPLVGRIDVRCFYAASQALRSLLSAPPSRATRQATGTTTHPSVGSLKGVSDFHVSVFPGDGIGPEVIAPCLELLRKVTNVLGGFEMSFVEASAGAACYEQTGSALPRDSMDEARRADAILLAAMGLPSIRYDDGTEIAPQLDLRFELGGNSGMVDITRAVYDALATVDLDRLDERI